MFSTAGTQFPWPTAAGPRSFAAPNVWHQIGAPPRAVHPARIAGPSLRRAAGQRAHKAHRHRRGPEATTSWSGRQPSSDFQRGRYSRTCYGFRLSTAAESRNNRSRRRASAPRRAALRPCRSSLARSRAPRQPVVGSAQPGAWAGFTRPTATARRSLPWLTIGRRVRVSPHRSAYKSPCRPREGNASQPTKPSPH
jgi:hypothetical protein